MPNNNQLSLIAKTWSRNHFSFGSSLLKGSHAKKKRPFRAKLPLHIVLKSSLASGHRSLLRKNHQIDDILEKQAQRHQVKIHAAAKGGNHLHILIQAPSREAFNAFVRSISGRIAQLMMGTSKEAKRESFRTRFWDARPFTRIVSFGRDFKNVCRYLGINASESLLGLSRVGARAMNQQIQNAVHIGRQKGLPLFSRQDLASQF